MDPMGKEDDLEKGIPKVNEMTGNDIDTWLAFLHKFAGKKMSNESLMNLGLHPALRVFHPPNYPQPATKSPCQTHKEIAR